MVFCASAASAEPPAAPSPKSAIDVWTAQLSSNDWKTRQNAMNQLVQLGDDALPRLHKLANDDPDEEVRTRAATAITQIEENRLLGASLITLNLKSVSPDQAYAELARQSHAPLLTDPPTLLADKNLKPVSLSADHQPFWKVLQELSAQCEFEVAPINRQNREIGLGMVRGSADWQDKPIALSGPLLIRADAINRLSTLRLNAKREKSQEFNIAITVFAEPKLRVLDYSSVLKLEQVTDDNGNSLIPPANEDAVESNAEVFGNVREGTTSRWEVGATLHYPKGIGQQITHFKATTTLQVQKRAAHLELPIAGARGVKRVLDGVRVSVKSLDAKQCTLVVDRDGRNDAQWYGLRMLLCSGEAVLLNDKGVAVAQCQNAPEVDELRDGLALEIRIRFARQRIGGVTGTREDNRAGSMQPAQLSWTFPIEVRELRVPFEFHDLPIP